MIGRKSDPISVSAETPRGFDSYELKLGDIMRGERATMGKSLLDAQRDLKIKASYIAAIENSDASAFETKGFIAGYVRSYARYLQLDPDWAYQAFCEESSYSGVNDNVAPARSSARSSVRQPATAKARPITGDDPLASLTMRYHPPSESVLSHIQPAAVFSLMVLVALIGALGYGGWTVLQQIQRVQLAPIDQAPGVTATLDPMASVSSGSEGAGIVMAAPSADALERLYRPQEL